MKNIYITSIPLQGRSGLQKVNYIPQDGIICDKTIETSFPIIPVIKATKNEEVENKIIVVRMKNTDTENNLKVFFEELSGLGIDKSCVSVVELEEQSDYATGTNMFLSLIKTIEDDSDVYACITFGTKLVSLIVSYVLVSIKDIFHNTYVKCVCYGQIDREDGVIKGARIWDAKETVNMCELARSISDLRLSNPINVLKGLFEGR